MPLSRSGEAPPGAADRALHWRANLRSTGQLLAVWFVVTFGISFFARELDFAFFGWPFSFWIAAQGALVVYLVIIAVYSRTMNRLDHLHGVADEE